MAQITRGGNSAVGSWPNPSPENIGDKWDDAISNGTDYDKRSLVKKSFADHVLEDEVLVGGMAQSDILKEMVKSMSGMLEAAEARIQSDIDMVSEETDAFDKSMAKAVQSTGSSFMELDERIGALQEAGPTPVQPVTQVEYLTKSQFGETTSPKAVLDTLLKGMEEGKVNPQAVVKFETTGELDPGCTEYVRKSLNVE